ncbi:hypothetical protein EDF88_5010 [Buttiauxella sp. BIGb0552]|uniref:hypothetical protein n=1 Tax=Buttiauxella sp. BIGb0552 TaxID=2485120 RepID=UPI00106466ED|nr:hypothetical protein [Buttiauxella sp. BIGb0552]TDX09595.1 hypothetical protein EDF88_5010 [Buttiauxella sp. BIGb0552]
MNKHPAWPDEEVIPVLTQSSAITSINAFCKLAKSHGYDTPGLMKCGVFAVSALRKGANPDEVLKSFSSAALPVIESRKTRMAANGGGNFAKLVEMLNDLK